MSVFLNDVKFDFDLDVFKNYMESLVEASLFIHSLLLNTTYVKHILLLDAKKIKFV